LERIGHGADRLLFEITDVDEKPFGAVVKSWRLPWRTDLPIGSVSLALAGHPLKKKS
jgi:hypothetical protein